MQRKIQQFKSVLEAQLLLILNLVHKYKWVSLSYMEKLVEKESRDLNEKCRTTSSVEQLKTDNTCLMRRLNHGLKDNNNARQDLL